jgi:hypothetical protein
MRDNFLEAEISDALYANIVGASAGGATAGSGGSEMVVDDS